MKATLQHGYTYGGPSLGPEMLGIERAIQVLLAERATNPERDFHVETRIDITTVSSFGTINGATVKKVLFRAKDKDMEAIVKGFKEAIDHHNRLAQGAEVSDILEMSK